MASVRSSYVAIEFPGGWENAFEAIDAVPATEIIHKRYRSLPWYDDPRHNNGWRVVVWVHGTVEAVDAQPDDAQHDPYRATDVGELEYRVPAALSAVVDLLGGTASLVDRGQLRFTTRRYEAFVRDQLITELTTLAGNFARGEFGVERRRLIGRFEGAIPKILELERRVARSGLVDEEQILVDYL